MSDLYPSRVPARGLGAWLKSAGDLARELPVVLALAVVGLIDDWRNER